MALAPVLDGTDLWSLVTLLDESCLQVAVLRRPERKSDRYGKR